LAVQATRPTTIRSSKVMMVVGVLVVE